MAESTADYIKYKILRFLDVTGFTVFDPIVRLAFKEDPKKQLESIGRYLIIPIVFITLCIGVWWIVAPKHKTKSGEVPTPDIVMESARINDTFSDREKTKQSDFFLEGVERETALSEVLALMAVRTTEFDILEDELDAREADYAGQLEVKVAPIQEKLKTLKALNRKARSERKVTIEALALKLSLIHI